MVTDVGALVQKPHFAGHRHEDGGRLVPSRTQYDLPSHDKIPYLEFARIAYFNGQPEAVFNGPNNERYNFTPAKINLAFQREKEAALCGDMYFDLPHFQQARHAFANSKVDRAIDNVLYHVETKFELGAAFGILAGGLYLVAGMATTMFNYDKNCHMESAFEVTKTQAVAGTAFGVNTGDDAVVLGTPAKGEYWGFGWREHEYCTVEKGPSGHLFGAVDKLSWLSIQYKKECTPIAELPEGHRGAALYPAAYTAFLQVAKPEGNYTPAKVDEILKAERDLAAAQKRYNAIKP